MAVCPPGAPDWTPRPAAPKDGYVLFFGTLEPRKNVGGLLDAYEQLLAAPERHRAARVPELVLAGRATDAAEPWLERISRPPLAGPRPPHRLRRRRASAARSTKARACSCSRRFDEGFGLPVLEAMTLGVPVVAADRGSLPEVLGGAGLLVDPDRPDDIAAAIARAARRRGLAAACAAQGRRARARLPLGRHRRSACSRRIRQAIERRARRRRRT